MFIVSCFDHKNMMDSEVPGCDLRTLWDVCQECDFTALLKQNQAKPNTESTGPSGLKHRLYWE